MPSADSSPGISPDYSVLSPIPWHATSLGTGEASRGKLSYRPCIDAGCIKHAPLWMEGFAVACQLAPSVPHLVSGACPSPRTFVPRFLQTLPRENALALPLSFGSTHTWTGGLSPPSMTACTAHTPKLSGGPHVQTPAQEKACAVGRPLQCRVRPRRAPEPRPTTAPKPAPLPLGARWPPHRALQTREPGGRGHSAPGPPGCAVYLARNALACTSSGRSVSALSASATSFA
jgi:hypothetical protein